MKALRFVIVTLLLQISPAGASQYAVEINSLVRAEGSPHIYYIDPTGVRHHVPNPDIQRYFFDGWNVAQVPSYSLATIQEGAPVGLPNQPAVQTQAYPVQVIPQSTVCTSPVVYTRPPVVFSPPVIIQPRFGYSWGNSHHRCGWRGRYR